MTKKIVKKTAAPISVKPAIKRKLNAQHRGLLLTLASTKFIDQPLRAAIATLFIERHQTEVEPFLDTLTKFNLAREVSQIQLGYNTLVAVGLREFELPNGDKVMRDETKSVDCPMVIREYAFSGVEARKLAREGMGSIVSHKSDCFINLDIALLVPGYRGNNSYEGVYHVQQTTGAWYPVGLKEAIGAFMVAGQARMSSERRMLRTIAQIIDASSYFEDVIQVWPEAATLENDLFIAPVRPTVFSLVVISNDDKALLCSNMASRGVSSAACAIAAE